MFYASAVFWEAVIEWEMDMACQPGSSEGSARGFFFGGCAGLFVVVILALLVSVS